MKFPSNMGIESDKQGTTKPLTVGKRVRPRFRLDMPVEVDPPPLPVGTSTDRLKSQLDTVLSQMNTRSHERTMPVDVGYSYAEACAPNSMLSTTVGTRRLGSSGFREWIELTSPDDVFDKRDKPLYVGDKIHLSVDVYQLAEAFPIVIGLLCAEGTPFQTMKVSNAVYHDNASEDVRSSTAALRVTLGAQFTLYIHPDGQDYTADHLAKIADAVRAVETALIEAGVGPGVMPKSDVSLGGPYASYRNEHASSREGVFEDVETNRGEPVYQCLMARHPAD